MLRVLGVLVSFVIRMNTTLLPLEDTPVLVAVVTQARDLARAQAEGWYRLPLAHAPPRLGCEVLALYQTGAWGAEGRCVRWWGWVQGMRVRRRRELLPDEADHPRADDLYLCFDLGPLRALGRPVPARRLRRVVFIPTTWGRLVQADDVAQLWPRPARRQALAQALQREALMEAALTAEDAEGAEEA